MSGRDQPTAGSGWSRPAESELVLLVAACAGARCRALRQLHGTGDRQLADLAMTVPGEDRCGAQLRAAVRDRGDAVLLSTGCLGACDRGSVAAVGWARTREHTLDWIRSPLLLTRVDLPARAVAAAEWIRRGAPGRATLPRALTRSGPG